MTAPVVIVGAGLAGVQAAVELRVLGFEGEIVLLGDEPIAYDRPPLSKDVLLGDARPVGLELLTAQAAADQRIDMRLGARVEGIDRAGKRVRLTTGEQIAYDRLILATGGKAAPLPALTPDNRRVFVIRSLDDADALADALQAGRRMLVVGAGWLGLEAAIAGAARGLKVVLIEQADRVCARSVPAEVSAYLGETQRGRGVDVRTGCRSRISLTADGVELAQEGAPPETFDLCVTAIGMAPDTALAEAAGLAIENGIAADERGRTSDPSIYAIGDAAAWWSPGLGRRQRLESWHSAKLQGRIVAADIAGAAPPSEAPWFWSDQSGALLQAAGMPAEGDRLLSAEDGDKPVWRYGQGDEATFVVGVNRPRDLRMAHRALSAPPSPPKTPETAP